MISDKLQTIFLIIFFVLVVLGFLWKFYPGTFYFSDNSKANNAGGAQNFPVMTDAEADAMAADFNQDIPL